MDKISNVNFTGISNIGTIYFKRSENSLSNSISMRLRNDIHGKDYTEYSDILKKIKNGKITYKNETSSDMLNIECIQEDADYTVLVNGEHLKPNDKNLPMFTYLAKLTKRIAGMDKMVVNKTYKEYEAGNNLIYGGEVKSEDGLDMFFDSDSIRQSVKDFNTIIQSIMEKFFGLI